jgi:hypothetical protein
MAAHDLAGLALSGGGIRSAAVNCGIVQALHRAGVFEHFDYMSTVSGGGYLGASISTLMRWNTVPVSEIAGTVTVESAADARIVHVKGATDGPRAYCYARDADLLVRNGDTVEPGQRLIARSGPRLQSEIGGTVKVEDQAGGRQKVTVTAPGSGEQRVYWYTRYERLKVRDGERIEAGHTLLDQKRSFGERFFWRVRPRALLLEMMMRLDETRRWVNLSDGGHIENLATIELLRRRCRVIVIGDGEADPEMHFHGLATLIRTARLDLGVQIDIDLAKLRLNPERWSAAHIAVGRIEYPGGELGYLVYLKASCTGDEDEAIGEYRHRNPSFPHESTADQFFNEGQFEAYRSLGQHIGESALAALQLRRSGGVSFAVLHAALRDHAPRDEANE